MDIYKHLVYNPHMKGIHTVIQEAQDPGNLESSREWQFVRTQPVTEYEWVAIFEKWQDEFSGTPTVSIREQVYLQATELSRGLNQTIGSKNEYYTTLSQLEMILEKF